VKIHYDVNLDDIVAWNLYHFTHSRAMRRTRLFNVWGPPAVWVFLATAAAALIGGPAAIFVLQIPVLIVSAVWVAAMPAYMRRLLTRNVRKLMSEGANKGTLGPHEMELTETHLIVSSYYSETKSRLEVIERVARTDSHTFVYMSAVNANTIPRAALGERDYEEFVEALVERVAKAYPRPTGFVSADRQLHQHHGEQPHANDPVDL
jgi:hypothetical protein